MNKQVIKDIDLLEPQEAQACEVKVTAEENTGKNRKLYIESYGCAMNFSDSEIVSSILKKDGFDTTSDFTKADVILLNTCSIRDKAEQTVRKRLTDFNRIKASKPGLTIGVLGCMAERLKSQLLEEEKIVDLVAGPDAYRDLPNLINKAEDGEKAINTFLSREETYADISPVRLNSNGVTAMISIMRGCDNICSFCVVPYTRGRERSRDPHSIVKEAQDLFDRGYREVTLLGQNVDSYKWSPNSELKGKAQIEKTDEVNVVNFAELLEMTAQVSPYLLIRFSTSHPKDITDEVLHVIAKYENICKHVHLPVQSGNNRILERMNRNYTHEWYLERVEAIRRIVGPDTSISSDMITGFCGETEEEHQDTLALMKKAKLHFSYMYYYSERPGTIAAKNFEDDVSLETKKRRLAEVITVQHQLTQEWSDKAIGKTYKVLIEAVSKKSEDDFKGRTTENTTVIFPKGNHKIGDVVPVKIIRNTRATLIGEVIDK